MRGNQIRFSIFKECALLGQAAPDELFVLAGLLPGPEEARLSSLDPLERRTWARSRDRGSSTVS